MNHCNDCVRRSSSGKSGDCVVSVSGPVVAELVVHGLPLEVVVMVDVDVTVDEWLPHVHEEEHWHDGECKSNPVAGEAEVDVPVALVSDE